MAQAAGRRQPHGEGAAEEAAEDRVEEAEGEVGEEGGGEGAQAPRQVAQLLQRAYLYRPPRM